MKRHLCYRKNSRSAVKKSHSLSTRSTPRHANSRHEAIAIQGEEAVPQDQWYHSIETCTLRDERISFQMFGLEVICNWFGEYISSLRTRCLWNLIGIVSKDSMHSVAYAISTDISTDSCAPTAAVCAQCAMLVQEIQVVRTHNRNAIAQPRPRSQRIDASVGNARGKQCKGLAKDVVEGRKAVSAKFHRTAAVTVSCAMRVLQYKSLVWTGRGPVALQNNR